MKDMIKTLRRLEKIVEMKEEEMERLNYEKYFSLFEEAFHLLKRKRVLMYGGTALNEMMPPRYKIYPPMTLPDIDILSPDAKRVTKDLVAHFKKYKHEAVSFSEALHEGTFKVFADGIQVVDVTQCSEETFNNLKKGSVVSSRGLRTVPPRFIRMTLHKMLSQPNDANRWKKVFERVINFYKVYPTVHCSLNKFNQIHIDDIILDSIYDVLIAYRECVFFGVEELNLLTGKLYYCDHVPPIQIIANTDLRVFASGLISILNFLQPTNIFPKDDFISEHVFLTYNGVPIVAIYQSDACLSYNTYYNRRIASINTFINMYLSMSLSPQNHLVKIRPYLECASNLLTNVMMKSLKSKKKLVDPFSSICYGPSLGMATMRRHRIKRIKNPNASPTTRIMMK